jgi:Zn-dependent protease with chaperone function
VTAAVLLLAFAATASTLGPALLERAAWPLQAPALGILAWQALSVAAALSLFLAGLALVMPGLHLTTDLAQLLRTCVEEMKHQYAAPAGVVTSSLGGLFAVGLIGRVAWSVALVAVPARWARVRHLQALDLLSPDSRRGGVDVLEHDEPLIYCVPGRGGRIVMTRGATRALSSSQIESAVAHEAIHLKARHHVAIMAASVLSRAFCGRGVWGRAALAIPGLAEMHADDGVVGRARRDLAVAIVRLASTQTPLGALSSAGGPLSLRVSRLTAGSRPLPTSTRWQVLAWSVVVVLVPLLLATIPAGMAVAYDCCHPA